MPTRDTAPNRTPRTGPAHQLRERPRALERASTSRHVEPDEKLALVADPLPRFPERPRDLGLRRARRSHPAEVAAETLRLTASRRSVAHRPPRGPLTDRHERRIGTPCAPPTEGGFKRQRLDSCAVAPRVTEELQRVAARLSHRLVGATASVIGCCGGPTRARVEAGGLALEDADALALVLRGRLVGSLGSD
jgi:hypothetical protein